MIRLVAGDVGLRYGLFSGSLLESLYEESR